MILCAIGASTWLVWALIGIIAGYMAGKLLYNRGVPVFAALCVGILSAVGGGYAFIRWFGQNDYGQTISLVGAAVVAAIVLWCLYFIFGRKPQDGEE
ncbi:MAG: hypothetical protein HFJ94_06275 [Muribaculaceae bacterium]|nr:hypothetical protein [Muribaculaceae bacterium]